MERAEGEVEEDGAEFNLAQMLGGRENIQQLLRDIVSGAWKKVRDCRDRLGYRWKESHSLKRVGG